MGDNSAVLGYKCPCCGASIRFGHNIQMMKCDHCGNEFDLDTVKSYNYSIDGESSESFQWEEQGEQNYTEGEMEEIRTFVCGSCGGELTTDQNTAATFCPYCDSPTILPGRLSGKVKPQGVIPFKTSKEDAKAAFLRLCKGKPLLPKQFMAQHRVEKITGMYVPFWLYDCESEFDGTYKATRVRTWSDSRYHYTKTDHFLLDRGCSAAFENIPMDGSSKLGDDIMESIEPFDYSQLVSFETAYLSGFFADKYDVESTAGEGRVKQRVSETIDDLVQRSIIGYASVIPTSKRLHVKHGHASYVLLPVWILSTKYADKTYLFAMNGQTGKMTGTFPICPKRSAAWFAGICGAVTLIAAVIQYLAFM